MTDDLPSFPGESQETDAIKEKKTNKQHLRFGETWNEMVSFCVWKINPFLKMKLSLYKQNIIPNHWLYLGNYYLPEIIQFFYVFACIAWLFYRFNLYTYLCYRSSNNTLCEHVF